MQQIQEDGTPMGVSDEFAAEVRAQTKEIVANRERAKEEER